ncbi:uncharacterized protein UV8b_01015 [Ustilaginoidea virens]|uniref:Uncharacterized protein n=1 Tax=Ustilaginoidea virens TaxID=1159556 RepID=A0A8E5HJT5_USTVR|nr:uncharacterized protein UV8b_01015 [Ustilaginoidea virens]QUC16774.1 hypothetical protein UV8b_01015 [Ustilaginoidea virens]
MEARERQRRGWLGGHDSKVESRRRGGKAAGTVAGEHGSDSRGGFRRGGLNEYEVSSVAEMQHDVDCN